MTPEEIQALIGSARLYPQSVQDYGGETFAYAKDGTQHYLLIGYNPLLPSMARDTFSGEVQDFDAETAIKWCLPGHSNARKLRRLFPWTAPQNFSESAQTYITGDVLGLVAPALIGAARKLGVNLLFDEPSPHALARINRHPEDALDAITWAVFREGYQTAWGFKETVHAVEFGTLWFAEVLQLLAQHNLTLFFEIAEFAGRPGGSEILGDPSITEHLVRTLESALTTKNDRGGWRFRDRIFQTLLRHEDHLHSMVATRATRDMEAWMQRIAPNDEV